MQVSKANLISSFATGRFPTGTDFENLIDSTYNDWLSSNTAEVDSLTATTITVNNVIINGNSPVSTSIIVSLFPSGSAELTFDQGILINVVTGP